MAMATKGKMANPGTESPNLIQFDGNRHAFWEMCADFLEMAIRGPKRSGSLCIGLQLTCHVMLTAWHPA